MKLNTLFSPAVFVIAFSIFISCKKSNNTASNPDKLKMYIEDSRNTPQGVLDSFTVTYDAKKRLTGLLSTILSEVYIPMDLAKALHWIFILTGPFRFMKFFISITLRSLTARFDSIIPMTPLPKDICIITGN